MSMKASSSVLAYRENFYRTFRRPGPLIPGVVLFYGVVRVQTEKVVEFFLERDAARR